VHAVDQAQLDLGDIQLVRSWPVHDVAAPPKEDMRVLQGLLLTVLHGPFAAAFLVNLEDRG
jgi:hypothetical protein